MINPTSHYLFVTWRMMNVRCYDPDHKAYHRYGGRGVTIDYSWRWDSPTGFVTFLIDVGDRPEGKTLDRIENDKGYTKSNVRWADKRTQQNNMGIGLANTSGEMGVCWSEVSKCWTVQISLNGETCALGNFNLEDKQLAAELYNNIKAIKIEKGDIEALKFSESLKNKSPISRCLRRNKTSDYYGVSWDNSRDKWRSMVSYRETDDGKLINKFIGRFDDEELAYKSVLTFLDWIESNGYFKKKVRSVHVVG